VASGARAELGFYRTNVVVKQWHAAVWCEVDRVKYCVHIYYIVLVTCCVRVAAVCGWTGFASGGVCAMVVRERSRKRSERKEVFFRRAYTYNNNILRLLLCLRRCRRSFRRKTERSVGLTRAIPPPSPTITAR